MSQPQSDDQVTQAWRQHRPYLINLAYQMLGDVGEAEDVAQEAFLRLSRADVTAIDDVRAWLTVVAGRLCLDQVRSARSRHERPEDIGSEVPAVNHKACSSSRQACSCRRRKKYRGFSAPVGRSK